VKTTHNFTARVVVSDVAGFHLSEYAYRHKVRSGRGTVKRLKARGTAPVLRSVALYPKKTVCSVIPVLLNAFTVTSECSEHFGGITDDASGRRRSLGHVILARRRQYIHICMLQFWQDCLDRKFERGLAEAVLSHGHLVLLIYHLISFSRCI
jgi:hypothetical protein